MTVVISGKELATIRRGQMKEEVASFESKYGRRPHLAVILVGEDPGSVSYVTGKGGEEGLLRKKCMGSFFSKMEKTLDTKVL